MPDFLQKIYDKLVDLFMKFTKKCDEWSQMIYERTGKKINIAIIIGAIILIIFVAIFVKAVLGIVWGKLSTGDY